MYDYSFILYVSSDVGGFEVEVLANDGDTFHSVCPVWAHDQLVNRTVDESDDGAYYDIFISVQQFLQINQPEGVPTMSNQAFARTIDDMEMQCSPSNTIGVSTMSQPLIKSATYFRGSDIKSMSKESLINALKTLEAEIKDLKAIETESVAIAKQIDELKGALAVVVGELDSRS